MLIKKIYVTFGLLITQTFFLYASYAEILAGRTGGQSAIVAVEEKKPLVTAFENTVFAAKKNDWKAVEKAINAVRKEIGSLDKSYGTGLLEGSDKAIVARDAAQLLNFMANAIFLAIREECKLAAADKFKAREKSLEHLDIAIQYYGKILSVNIARKDPSLDKSIQSSFEDAIKSVENADEGGYDKAVQTIESSILKVYVKFQQKKSGQILTEIHYCLGRLLWADVLKILE